METGRASLSSVLVALLLLGSPCLAAGPVPSQVRIDAHGNALPPGALARLGTVRLRQRDEMERLVFSPDSQRIGSSGNGHFCLWDCQTGRRLQTLTLDREVLLQTPFGRALFTPDGKGLVSADSTGQLLHRWDLSTGKEIARWAGPGGEVTSLALSANGSTLACGTYHGRVWIGTLDGKMPPSIIPFTDETIESVSVWADGKVLTVAGVNWRDDLWTVRLVDVATSTVRNTLRLRALSRLALSADGRMIAASDRQGGLWLQEMTTGKQTVLAASDLPEKIQPLIYVASFSADGRTLLSVNLSHETVLFWDVSTGKQTRALAVPGLRTCWGRDLLISPDGSTLASSASATLHLWDARSGKPLLDLPGHTRPPTDLVFSRDGRTLTSYSAEDGLMRWDVRSTRRLTHVPLARVRPEGEPTRLSPEGKWAALVWGNQLDLQAAEDGKRVQRLPHGAWFIRDVAFSPDGTRLASVYGPRAIHIWDVDTGRPVQVIRPGPEVGLCTWVAFLPDGEELLSGDGPFTVHRWDLATGQRRDTLRTDPARWRNAEYLNWPWDCRVTPDGRTLVVSNNGRMIVWDLMGRKEGEPLEVDENDPGTTRDFRGPSPLVLSSDGRLLARRSAGKSWLLHELASGRIIYRFKTPSSSLAFSPEGRTLATGQEDNSSILLWDLFELFRQESPPGADKVPLARWWDDLAKADAERAYRAIAWLLVPPAVPFLSGRLRPVARVERERLMRLVRDLGDADFTTRQKATDTLREARESAREALEQADREGESLEVRLRARRLLDTLAPRAPERLREARAVQVLECLGSPEAMRLLEQLAGGIPEARLTQEAQAALKRRQRTVP
jgi:WD40 repeat protein